MWIKVKKFVEKWWKWILTGLGTILALILLGRRRGSTTSNIAERMKESQGERLKEAEEVSQSIQGDIKRADDIMSNYYKKKLGR